MRRRWLVVVFWLVCVLAVGVVAQQVPDPTFDPRVVNPAYKAEGPKTLFDEAHNNFHTASGRYKPFADLISNDGYRISPNRERFSKQNLASYDILIIANPLGAARLSSPEANNPAFTEEECDTVRDWVRAGGALLLIADHYPVGGAAGNLAGRFGVEMSNAYTDDPSNYDPDLNEILFSRGNELLADHAITRGREASERINRVATFTGQSLKGPPESSAFLKLADTAYDALPPDETRRVSAAGRAQGIALEFGEGRAVFLGEAAMLTAQLGGPQKVKFGGLNRPTIDNRQLALNIMHWLSRLLE